MSAEAVIAVARGELGYTETKNNITKYWQEYDPAFQGQPWCVAFLWWCFRQADESTAFFGGGKTASCGILLRWYRGMGYTVPLTEVQPGDIVILDFSGAKTDTQHCGLVTEVGWISHGTVGWIRTIEGNTSKSGSQSNGGEVCEKVRYPSQIVAVCRPHYKKEVKPVDDVSGHWAEKSIRWELDSHISNGYPDGSYKPNDSITRAEDATKLYRFYELVETENGELRQENARLKTEVSGLREEVDTLKASMADMTALMNKLSQGQ